MGVAPGRRASGPGLRWHGSTKAWRSPPTLQAHPSASSPHPVRHRLGSPWTRPLAPPQTRDPLLRDVKARLLPPTIARQQDDPEVARRFQPVPERGRIPDRPWSAYARFMDGSDPNLARLRARCPGHGAPPGGGSTSSIVIRQLALRSSAAERSRVNPRFPRAPVRAARIDSDSERRPDRRSPNETNPQSPMKRPRTATCLTPYPAEPRRQAAGFSGRHLPLTSDH